MFSFLVQIRKTFYENGIMIKRGGRMKKTIGLALSGGGIKSFSQLPVLKALDQEGISLDAVSGTSMGSVIAAFVAIGMPIDELVESVLALEEEVEHMKLFNRNIFRVITKFKDKNSSGLVDGIIFEQLLNKYFKQYGVEKITDVKIPLAIPAVDIVTGKIIVFVSHPDSFKKLDDNWEIISDVSLAKAVRASSSFPFFIDACPVGQYMLTDGGVRMNLPLPLITAYGIEQKIAVTMHNDGEFHNFESATALSNRVFEMIRMEHDKYIVKDADVLINVPLEGIWVFEVGRGKYTMRQGALAVEEKMKEIKGLKSKKSWLEQLLERKDKDEK